MRRSLLPCLFVLSGCHWVFPFAGRPAEAGAEDAVKLDFVVDAPATERPFQPDAAADAPFPFPDMALEGGVEASVTPDLEPDLPLPDAKQPDGGIFPGTWVTILKGTFTMGSPTTEPCRNKVDETQHQVTLTHDFEIQTTEVTQGQFSTVMGYNPASLKSCGADCPVESANWHEAVAYCNALSTIKGYAACYQCSGSGPAVTCQEAPAYSGQNIYVCPGYRLPTEAEWEYAYRAGTQTAFYSGANTLIAGCIACDSDPNADAIGWYCPNSGATAHPVQGKQPNAWNLYDMAGNVWEWCHDWRLADLGSAPVVDPWGPATGTFRVVRGGSWSYPSPALRAASRHNFAPTTNFDEVGFRCVRTK